MRKNIFFILWQYGWLFICLFQLNLMMSQTSNNTISVVRMSGNSGYKSYLDTNIGIKSMLLDKGTIGQGTFEFWAKFKTSNQGVNLTTDAVSADKNFRIQFTKSEVTLANKGQYTTYAINPVDVPFDVVWQHFAITINPSGAVNTYNLDLYIDGEKVKTFNDLEISTNSNLYFTKGQITSEVLLTEIRAWNVSRTGEQIALNRYVSYSNLTNATMINNLVNEGLVANYSGGFNLANTTIYFPEVNYTEWKNTIQKPDYPPFAKIATSINNPDGDKLLAEVQTNLGNPIEELDAIIVNASKGKFNNKIEIKWFHINELTNYTVYRDNIRIGTVNNVTGQSGTELSYIDTDVLPGTIYTYRIDGINASNVSRSGDNKGFIFPNGTISGNIKTQSQVYVDNVGVEIGLSSPSNGTNGNCLQFAQDSKKITILDRQLFTNNPNITLEFWYKNNTTTPTTANSVFKLATTEILMATNNATLKWGVDQSVTFSTGVADTAWHHYAFALGSSGVEVFKDGVSIGASINAFSWATTNIDMNAYINYAALYDYSFDEFRVWQGKKSLAEVKRVSNYIVDSDESNLLIAYSFDLTSPNEIYNHALVSKGGYIGKSEGMLTYGIQPSNLKYVAYTDTNGNYSFSSIYSKSPNGNDYTAKAFKPNHEFRPATVGALIKQSILSADYSKTADFTDISELPVAGRIYYLENGEKYPVPAGKVLAIDGNPLVGLGTALQSNLDGVYSVSSSLGLHSLEVSNPELTNNLIFNSLQFSPVIENGKVVSKGYAVSNKYLNYSGAGVTISGFVKPYYSVDSNTSAPDKQTLVKWNKFEIVLANNNTVQFLYDGEIKLYTSGLTSDNFNFFGVSIDQAGNIGLLVNNEYKSGVINGVSFTNELLYLGATTNPAGTVIANCVSNLSLIQFRNKSYDNTNLEAIKDGSIIPNDEAVLDFSFEMDQEKGMRLISKTSLGKDTYLNLHDQAKLDQIAKLNYSKKYVYSYQASNPAYNPAVGSAKYNLNIVDPITSVDFEMKTRYGFIGNIVIPCDNSIGAWTGVITRTDSTNPKFEKIITAQNFNLENKLFKVDGLLPGKYQVTLTNNTDSSIKLISPILDLTQGWETYDFEYRAPLSIDVNLYTIKEAKAGTKYEDLKTEDFELLQKVCQNNYYVIKSGNSLLAQAVVYEKYGDQKCYINDAQVTFTGDMIKMADGTTSATSATDAQGRSILISYAALPNFISPYLRSLTVQATHNSRVKTSLVTALLEGAKMNQSDFTIDDPVVDIIVHDPPGDASSATLKKGHKTLTSGKWKTSVGYTTALVNKIGTKVDQSLVSTIMGVGTSVAILSTQVNTGLDFGWKISGSYNGTTVTETETFTDITTSSSESLVGKKADLFVGKGFLITVGTGEALNYDTTNCSVVYNTNAQVLDNQIENLFVHSYYDIQKNMIPNFLTAYLQETDNKKKISYENSISKWIDELLKNDYLLNDYKKSDYNYMINYSFLLEKYNSLPETYDTTKYDWANYKLYADNFNPNRSFDGGGAITTVSILNSNGTTNGADFDTALDVGYRTTVKGTFGTVSSEFEYKNIGNFSVGGGFNMGDTNYELAQFKLSDNDAGDRFAIEIKKDPYFGKASPVFRTLAGKSSCPAEKGTQLRNGVEIVADSPIIANGLNTEVLKYKIKLRNTQNATNQDTPRTYKLSVPVASNPYGASVTVNGSSANGALFTFGPDPNSPTGIKQEITANVEIKMSATDTRTEAEYKDIQLMFSVPCEEHSDIGFTHNADVYQAAGLKSVDNLYLTAQFHGPCIATMGMQTPQTNWVVNANSQNKQNFVFTIPGVTVTDGVVTLPNTLTNVDIEYALKENNTPRLLRTITAEELKQNYSENAFRFSIDVSGLPNGEYGFRMVPVCGIGTESWRRNTPTAFVYGLISRDAPTLLETNPVDGGVLQSGSITATYNKALDPTTLNSLNIALRGTLGGLPKNLISVDFKNKGNKITIPYGNFLNLTSAYTIEFWINPASYPVAQGTNIIGKGSNYSLWLQPDGKLNYNFGNSSANTAKAIPLYEWTHVAAVYDGSTTWNFYFNGELVHSVTDYNLNTNPLLSNTNDLTIGGFTNNEGFVGQMDEIRIWSIARSQAQIASFKNRQLLGNENNLQAYYTLDNNALIVDGYQEAVRDYTGNTRGSSAEGISWIVGDMAAPLTVEQLVQDIPISISTNLDKNQIIISPLNFQEYYLEGAKLTAVIAPNRVKGIDGNNVAATSWTFTINKNNVVWTKANISATQSMGQSIAIDAWLKNQGGSNATFELQNLPEWLKCSTVAVGNSIGLNAGFEKKLTFTTSAYLNKGIYNANIGVITYNEAGEKTGYEYFALEVTVNCQAPNYNFNAGTYALMKEFTAQLTIADELSTDTNDVVVAYFNNEIRGKANVTKINGKPIVNLTVFYNAGEQGALTFHVWDDSQCKEYVGLTDQYYLDTNDSQGSFSQPVPFVTGDLIIKRIPVLTGYQWVSFNVTDTSTTSLPIIAIKGMEQGDEITELGTTNKATFDANGNPTGTLTVIDFKKAYQVYSLSNKMIMAIGKEASIKTNIDITGNITDNYIGYIPKVMFSSSYALRSLSNKFTIGDKISGRDGFAEFTSEGWKGTLTHLIANKAYKLKMSNSGILNYSGYITSNLNARTAKNETENEVTNAPAEEPYYLKLAAQKGIQVNGNKYPETMAITATVSSLAVENANTYVLVALAQGEYRGIAKPVIKEGEICFFMTVYGNGNENVQFKLITEEGMYNISEKLVFNSNSFVGNYQKMYPLHILNETEITEGLLSIDQNPVSDKAIISIHPTQTDVYELSLYSLNGSKIANLFEGKILENTTQKVLIDRQYNSILNHLPEGTYLCKLSGSETSETIKVIIK